VCSTFTVGPDAVVCAAAGGAIATSPGFYPCLQRLDDQPVGEGSPAYVQKLLAELERRKKLHSYGMERLLHL